MMKRIVTVLFAAACLLFLAASCEKHDDALRVEMRVDGELYTCPAYSYDTYFPVRLVEDPETGGFSFSMCRYLSSGSGEKANILIRLNETEPFELNRQYRLDGNSVEGGSYAQFDWTFDSVEGWLTFLGRWDEEDASYLAGRFEFSAVDDRGKTVRVTGGVFENLSVVVPAM